MNHVDSQSAKAWAPKRGLGRMKHEMLMYIFVQDVVEKKQTTLAYVNTNSNKADLDDKVSYLRSAHVRLRNAGSETQQRRRENSLETVTVR